MSGTEYRTQQDAPGRREFAGRVLEDLRALETMLESGMFETGVVRLGAEQEVFLVDPEQRPAPVGPTILERLGDPHLTSELARFNLEINLDPVEVRGDALRRFEAQTVGLLDEVRRAAKDLGASVVLCGILPTLEKEDLTLDAMTPKARYLDLEEAMREQRRGRRVQLRILGRDELALTHDNMMIEACNTSFQVHRQVDPGSFRRLYNIAQLVTAPVLAAAVNSPLLLGKVLWRESRIALFRQAVDTRDPNDFLREERGRVTFGDGWVDDSVLELLREDVSRFGVMLTREIERDPRADLRAGRVPRLEALALHNGTVYRWNRPCFGVEDGKAHLRIENRVLPAGPSVVDEMANAALWIGAIEALDRSVGDVRRKIAFETVRENFFNAARTGLDAQLGWLGGRRVPARDLVRSELIPAAREALRALEVDSRDVDRLLWVVWERVRERRTGAQWLIDGFDGMAPAPARERCAALTAELVERQLGGAPIVEWPRSGPRLPPRETDLGSPIQSIMRENPPRVSPDDIVGLAAALMEWRHVRCVPVEQDGRFLGVVTHRGVLRALLGTADRVDTSSPVRDVMEVDVITVGPSAPLEEGIERLCDREVAFLPVVEEGRLVGLVTRRELLEVLEDALRRIGEEGGDGEANAASDLE